MSITAVQILTAKVAALKDTPFEKSAGIADMAGAIGRVGGGLIRAPLDAARGALQGARGTKQLTPQAQNTNAGDASHHTQTAPVINPTQVALTDPTMVHRVGKEVAARSAESSPVRSAIHGVLPNASMRGGAMWGGLAGAALGAMNPGKDDEGESRGVLSGAIRGAIPGMIVGGVAGHGVKKLVNDPLNHEHQALALQTVNARNAGENKTIQAGNTAAVQTQTGTPVAPAAPAASPAASSSGLPAADLAHAVSGLTGAPPAILRSQPTGNKRFNPATGQLETFSSVKVGSLVRSGMLRRGV